MPTQFERHSLEHATWTYPEVPTMDDLDVSKLLEEYSLATQRMCRAFDRGDIDGATHHRLYAAEIAEKIKHQFECAHEQADNLRKVAA